jgi:hypothetical protein
MACREALKESGYDVSNTASDVNRGTLFPYRQSGSNG